MLKIRLIFAYLFFVPQLLLAQCLQPKFDMPEVYGAVSVMKSSSTGDTLYMGGNFTEVSPKVTGSLAMFGKDNFAFQNSMPIVGNTVNAIVSDGSGGWYIAGKFVKINPGIDRFFVARINSDGSLHPFSVTVNSEVKTLQFAGDRLFIGGAFSQVNNEARSSLAAVDTNGVLLPWAPNLNSYVHRIVYKNNKVYVGGDFTTVGGLPQQRIAIFDTINSVPNSFSANINGTVYDIEVDDSLIYFAGEFTTINSATRNFVAALRLQNASLHSFNANIVGNQVMDIHLYNNKLVLAGTITSVGLQPRKAMAVVNRTSGLVISTSLNITHNASSAGDGNIIYVHQSNLFLGGDFKYVNGNYRRNFIAMDTGTFVISNIFKADFNHSPLAFGSNQNNILIGGAFNAMGTRDKRGFFAYRVSTNEILEDGVRFTGSTVQINDINFYNDQLIFGGSFDTINGMYRKNLCMVDFNGVVNTWNLPADNLIKKVLVYQDKVFVIGSFANIGGLARTKLAVLNAGSSSVVNFAPNPNGSTLNDILLVGNRFFVCGNFTQISSTARAKLASFSIAGNTISLDNFSATLAASHTLKKLMYFNNRIYVLSDSTGSSYTYGTIFSLDTTMALSKTYRSLKVFTNYNINTNAMAGFDSLIVLTYYYSAANYSTYVTAIEPSGQEITPLLIGGYYQLFPSKIGERIYLYGNVEHIMNIAGNSINYLDLANRPTITLSKESFCQADTITVSSSVTIGNRWQNGSTDATYSYVVPNLNAIRFYTLAPMPGCSLSLSKLSYIKPWNLPANNAITYTKNPKCTEDTITLLLSSGIEAGTKLLWQNLDTNASIKVFEPGNYEVVLANEQCSRKLLPVQISNYAIPQAPSLNTLDTFFHICADTQIVLSASGGLVPYYWSTGYVGTNFILNKTGDYHVYYKSVNGCKSLPSKSVFMVADTLPEFPVIEFANKMTVCGMNDSLEIKANIFFYDSLRWSNGEIGKSSVFAKAGSAPISVQNKNGACVRNSFTINIIDDKPSKPIITASGPLSFCTGANVTLSSSFNGSNKWTTTSTSKSINVNQTGAYSVQAIVNGCASEMADTVVVNVFAKPGTPTLTLYGDTLKVNSNDNIIWYRNGVQVSVGSVNYFVPITNGLYTARARNSNLCLSDLSNSVNFQKTGLEDFVGTRGLVNVYPNPAGHFLKIVSLDSIEELMVLDASGKLILMQENMVDKSKELSLLDFPIGIFTLAVKVNGQWCYTKILKLE